MPLYRVDVCGNDMDMPNPCRRAARVFHKQYGQFTGETMQPDACEPADPAPLLRTDYRCGCANQKYEWRARSQTCEQRECSPAQSERCHTANTVGCRVIGLAEQFECVCRWPFSGRSFCSAEINPCFVHSRRGRRPTSTTFSTVWRRHRPRDVSHARL